jgi:hypothetical protein
VTVSQKGYQQQLNGISFAHNNPRHVIDDPFAQIAYQTVTSVLDDPRYQRIISCMPNTIRIRSCKEMLSYSNVFLKPKVS